MSGGGEVIRRLRTGNIGNMQRGRGFDRGEVGRGDVTERVTEAKEGNRGPLRGDINGKRTTKTINSYIGRGGHFLLPLSYIL